MSDKSIVKKYDKPKASFLSVFTIIGELLRNIKIQTRLLISFILISLVPLAMTGYMAYKKSSLIMEKKISGYSTQIVKQISKNISTDIIKFQQLSSEIALSKDILDGMEGMQEMDDFSNLSSKDKTPETIENISDVAQESAATSQEVSASTEEQIADAESLLNMAENLKQMAEELGKAVSIFKV